MVGNSYEFWNGCFYTLSSLGWRARDTDCSRPPKKPAIPSFSLAISLNHSPHWVSPSVLCPSLSGPWMFPSLIHVIGMVELKLAQVKPCDMRWNPSLSGTEFWSPRHWDHELDTGMSFLLFILLCVSKTPWRLSNVVIMKKGRSEKFRMQFHAFCKVHVEPCRLSGRLLEWIPRTVLGCAYPTPGQV